VEQRRNMRNRKVDKAKAREIGYTRGTEDRKNSQGMEKKKWWSREDKENRRNGRNRHVDKAKEIEGIVKRRFGVEKAMKREGTQDRKG
jgi:hypothetical protein